MGPSRPRTSLADQRQVGPTSLWTADLLGEVAEDTIPGVLARRLPELADTPAVTWWANDAWQQMSFAQLADDAELVARAIAGSVEPGSRVAVWGRNSVPYVVLLYGCALAGAVLTPLNTGWSDDEAVHGLQLTTPGLMFAGRFANGDEVLPRASALAGAIPVHSLDGLLSWARDQPPGPLPELRPTDPFLIQFTSGTTGRAKGAVVSHRGAINGALQRNLHDVTPPNDVWLNPVPYHHVGGSCFVILGGLMTGGAFVMVDRWDPVAATALLRTGVVTRVGGVPTMLVDLLDRLGDEASQTGVVSVSLGGATVRRSLVERIRKTLDAPTVISYGQSECPLISSTSLADNPETIARTVGRPLPGATVRIADVETGEICPIGVPGEIQVQSPNVMSGYWDDPEQTSKTMTADGFLRTGDLAVMDEWGYLEFRDRARDVIIRGGENIYPAEIEDLLVQHPQVLNAVLVGIDDERLGERVGAAVVLAPDSSASGDDLADYLSDKVARFKIPVAWRFVDQLPMTVSGKVRRFVVRQETNSAASEAAPTP
ncbi:class I adenylate-forming enzyme family protein [Mumia sp. Pv 4-285]|uniref:class I adenylate-forming enzyme family protein n=1 Tax=Mumia qirimensis TaxID=3234852 RepID=UPI00351D71A7